jgi:hypothetical protein
MKQHLGIKEENRLENRNGEDSEIESDAGTETKNKADERRKNKDNKNNKNNGLVMNI